MQLEDKEYLIVQIGNVKSLARVESAKSWKVKVFSKDCTDSEIIAIEPNNVLAALGPKPAYGTVHGIPVEPLRKTLESDFWEEIRIYRRFSKEEQTLLDKANASFVKRVEKAGLNFGIKIVLSVRPPKGKNAGMYYFRPKAEQDVCVIRPPAQVEDTDSILYALAHEYGHALWYRCTSSRSKWRWIKMYHTAVAVENLGESDLNAIREELVQAGSISAYLDSCEADFKPVFKSVLKHIRTVHRVGSEHLDIAIRSEQDLKDMWPTRVELSEASTLLTDYARKNPEELFAEAFALHFTGIKLPKELERAMTKTLSVLVKPKQQEVEQ